MRQRSCGTGSNGHYAADAATFVHEWQADYLKAPAPAACLPPSPPPPRFLLRQVDFCGAAGYSPPCINTTDPRCVPIEPNAQLAAWAALRDALNATGRPIYYSICPHARADGQGTARPFSVIYAPPAAWGEACAEPP